jgi:hypothetical protein
MEEDAYTSTVKVEPSQRQLRRRAKAPRYDFSEDEDVTELTAEAPRLVQESKKRRRKATDVTAYDSGAEATKEDTTPEKSGAAAKANQQKVSWLCQAFEWQLTHDPEPVTPAWRPNEETTQYELEALLASIRGH